MSYNRKFYEEQVEGSLRSAEEVVPLIIELVKPRSVADVGCGVGPWLSVFLKHGVKDVAGFDGDHVPRDMLMIPPETFRAVDLKSAWAVDRTFDLAMSVEVAEHLPPDAAPGHVASLTRLAPVVVFATAIPFKGGTGHLNEQWPSYWHELFAQHQYVVIDALRPRIWGNRKIEPFYRQDLLVYAKDDQLGRYPLLQDAQRHTRKEMLSVVHPEVYIGRNYYPLAPVPHLFLWVLRLAAGRTKQRLRGFIGNLVKRLKG